MMNNEKEIINVNWEGPFSISDILDNPIDSKKFDIGLYQIYGSHPLYGSDVLVYIGRTQNKNGFKSRLKGRWVIENGTDANNVQIYLGTIFSDSKKYTDEEIKISIEKAEILMINALKPAFNSSNIQSAKVDGGDYTVYNYGSYRSIYPILDSEYFWKDSKNFITVERIAEEYKKSKKISNDAEVYGFEILKLGCYKVWFGVEYEIWDSKEHVCPLCLEVYEETDHGIIAINKLKNLNFIVYEYEDKQSVSYLPLEIGITKNQIDIKIKEIKNILE
uniref:hypothetical protein n=1 Tax=Aliarcobacter sp. TaxID=2321116 RepID=UPI0040479605